MNLAVWLKETSKPHQWKVRDEVRTDPTMLRVRPHLVLGNGTILSVQASIGHYCSPRSNEGSWTHVEAWVIKDNQTNRSALVEYENDYGDPLGYVPLETIEQFIRDNGGYAGTCDWTLEGERFFICAFCDTKTIVPASYQGFYHCPARLGNNPNE